MEFFAKLGGATVEDLLLLQPRRYEDRRTGWSIGLLPLKVPATVLGRIVAQGTNYYAKKTKSTFEFILDDGTGRLDCRWWNVPWLAEKFRVGDEVFVHGKLLSLKPRTMDHPETEIVESDGEASTHLHRIVPVYPLTEGLSQGWLRGLLFEIRLALGRGKKAQHHIVRGLMFSQSVLDKITHSWRWVVVLFWVSGSSRRAWRPRAARALPDVAITLPRSAKALPASFSRCQWGGMERKRGGLSAAS